MLYSGNVLNFYNIFEIKAISRINSVTVKFAYRVSTNGLEEPYIISLTKLQVS